MHGQTHIKLCTYIYFVAVSMQRQMSDTENFELALVSTGSVFEIICTPQPKRRCFSSVEFRHQAAHSGGWAAVQCAQFNQSLLAQSCLQISTSFCMAWRRTTESNHATFAAFFFTMAIILVRVKTVWFGFYTLKQTLFKLILSAWSKVQWMVVFRLSPCSECSLCSFGNFPSVRSIKADVSELNVGSIVLGDQE